MRLQGTARTEGTRRFFSRNSDFQSENQNQDGHRRQDERHGNRTRGTHVVPTANHGAARQTVGGSRISDSHRICAEDAVILLGTTGTARIS